MQDMSGVNDSLFSTAAACWIFPSSASLLAREKQPVTSLQGFVKNDGLFDRRQGSFLFLSPTEIVFASYLLYLFLAFFPFLI